MYCTKCGALNRDQCKCSPLLFYGNWVGQRLHISEIVATKIMRPSTRLAVTDNGKIMQAWQCINTGEVEWRELERYEDISD